MWLAMGAFFLSLAGIATLFALKHWEIRRGRAPFPGLRERADQWAFRLQDLSVALQADIEKLPGEALHVARVILHEIALGLAALLRFMERKMHELAELVSHKHRFERRAPRSEFLKKVSEHRNGSNGGGATSDL